MELDPGGAVERRAREIISGWESEITSLKGFEHALITSVHLATAFYSHTPQDVQLRVTVYNTLLVLMDDSRISALALSEFMERFYSSIPQLHPALDRMVDTLRSMNDYFPPVGVKAIVQATVEYANMCALEPLAEEMCLHPAALSYVLARRMKTGVAEPFIAYIFPKTDCPDVSKWLQAMP